MLSQLIEEINKEPTQEMIDYFYERTNRHIDFVQESMEKIIESVDGLDIDELKNRAASHDKSKFDETEIASCIWMTWYRKKGMVDKMPEPIKSMVEKATKSHITTNDHHTEYYDRGSYGLKEMSDEAIAEMVADWASMSRELDNSIKEWADKFIPKKSFTDEQKKFIYKLVGIFE